MDLLESYNVKEKANSGSFLHLRAPGNNVLMYEKTDGEEDRNKPIGIWYLGKDSDKFNQIQHQKVNNAISGKKSQRTSEEIETDSIELIAALGIGWENIAVGGDTEFSQALLAKLLTKQKWIREQSDLFIGDRANFI